MSGLNNNKTDTTYLFIARGLNEPDNNTPSDEIWARIVRCKNTEVRRYQRLFIEEFERDYEYGAVVIFEPIENLEDTWMKVSEIW